MYEFHGWFGLAETTEESDAGNLAKHLNEVSEIISLFAWPLAIADLQVLNGQHFLSVTGLVNRRRDEARTLNALLTYLATNLPGSWGLLYERADDMPDPPGPNAFRVRVLARGTVAERVDENLSPCRPVIED